MIEPVDLQKALIRRGYDVVLDQRSKEWMLGRYDGIAMFSVKSGDRQLVRTFSYTDLAITKATLAEMAEAILEPLIDHKHTGRRHRQCVQCGTPLLFYGKYLYEEGNCLKWYMCQKVGTQSPFEDQLEVCPGCGIELSGKRGYPPPLKEIEDSDEQ